MASRKRFLHPTRLSILLALAAVSVLAGCGGGGGQPAAQTTNQATGPPATVRLALDWTPNTNHTGFFVALAKGYYKDAGIDFKVIPYSNAATDTLVGHGRAECGINFEDFMSIAVVAGTPEKSVMAILQSSPLAIMVRADSSITRPRDLDGKTYGGFGLPGETEIIRAIIRNDGGKGDFKNVTLDTAAYDAVYSKKVDFSEGYLTWEVIEARLRNIAVRLFPIENYGFPPFYSVVLACSTTWLDQNPNVAKRFIAASVKGWEFAAQHPDEAGKILIDQNPGVFSNPNLVYDSAKLQAQKYLLDSRGRFGCQTLKEWTDYPQFLFKAGAYKDSSGKALASPPDYSQFFTNGYLPYSCS